MGVSSATTVESNSETARIFEPRSTALYHQIVDGLAASGELAGESTMEESCFGPIGS